MSPNTKQAMERLLQASQDWEYLNRLDTLQILQAIYFLTKTEITPNEFVSLAEKATKTFDKL